MKKIICVLLLLTIALSLAACGEKTYADDIKVADIDAKVIPLVPIKDGYYKAENDFLDLYFEGIEVSEFVVEMSTDSSNVNQIGIFHAKDGKASDAKKLCDDYLSSTCTRLRTIAAAYSPAEIEKLDAAETKLFGNYVVFVILNSTDKAAVFDGIEKMLAK